MMERLVPLVGICVLLGIGVAFSRDRRRISWRMVATGIGMQAYLALFLVRSEWVPVVLPIATVGATAALVFARGGLAFGAARLLGFLGIVTTAVYLFRLDAWVGVAFALVVWVALRFGRRYRDELRFGVLLFGCLAPVALLYWGGLPNDFLFRALAAMGDKILLVIGFAAKGGDFVFGGIQRTGFSFAIDVGAIVLFFASLMSVLYYVGFLPWLVGLCARVLRHALGVSGAEALAAAANVFIGQTEAPLVVRPYLARMTPSEITALMAGGFATIAGSVFGAYVKFLADAGLERGAADLIAASVMSAPAAFVFAKLFVPETGRPETLGGAAVEREGGRSLLEAVASGVTSGVRLAVNIAAMLLVFTALIHMLDALVAWSSARLGLGDWTFGRLFGYLFAPFAYLMGVPLGECVVVGELMGTKTIFNEFLAYKGLGDLVARGGISVRSAVLATYALCGFANFASIGVQIGGLSALAPSRRAEFARLAVPAMVAGALACQLTACIVAVLGDF